MKISFALMSGGEGRRFGSDKTKAMLWGKPLYMYGLELGLSASADVMHISRDTTKYKPFKDGVRYFTDAYPFQCPMAGMITAGNNSYEEHVFILSADSPLMDIHIIEYCKNHVLGFDAVVPIVEGKICTLAALYSKKMLQSLVSYYETGLYKINACFHDYNIHYFNFNETAEINIFKDAFVNVNTLSELEKIEKNLNK